MKILLILLLFGFEVFAEEWPKEMKSRGTEITVYQPQIERFDQNNLEARAAVMITSDKLKDPVWGAVWIKAIVLTDRESREVELESAEVTDAKFPGQDTTKIAELKEFLAEEIPDWDIEVTMDDIIASVEAQKSGDEKFGTDPPEIIHVKYPAVLITIDGQPVFKKLEKTPYEYVINTPFFIIKDKEEEMYYLKAGILWYEAEEIREEWEWTDDIPDDLLEYVNPKLSEEERSIDPDTIEVKPEIILRIIPAELIVTDEEPDMASIKGTSLLFVKDTESDVIFDITSQLYYILISGRWFLGQSLEGPWAHVDGERLPEDFKKIPPESEVGNVLMHVPGTEQAKDAVLDTQIPQTAKVDRDKTIEVKYDGEPKFEPIKDSDLQYAVNTDKSVIKFKATYFCCDSAIWYEATNPSGPWTVSDSIPDAIYKMTPESPVYNVKYVYIYDSTPEEVVVGYYPGYTGCYVSSGAVIYGTGYAYPPYYGNYYYPRPVTYGFSMHYNPYTGWSFGFGMSFGGPAGFFSVSFSTNPYYGGYWGAGGYHAGYHHGYQQGRRSGFYAGYKYRDNQSRGNQVSHFGSEGNRNLYRDKGAQVNTNDRPGRQNNVSTMDKQRGNVSTMDRQRDQAGTKNNVFSDKQGNVYKKDNNEWQKREGNQWSSAYKDKDRSTHERNQQDLNKQYNSREKGNQRNQTYNQQRSSPRSSPQRRSGGRRR